MIGSIEREKDSSTFTLISPEYVERLEEENKQLKETIEKAIELVKKGIDFKSIYFKRNENTEMWQILLIDDIKDRFLEILGDKQ